MAHQDEDRICLHRDFIFTPNVI